MNRWKLHPTEDAIVWEPRPGDLHTDDLEMAGHKCAFVVTYGQDENGLVLKHHPIFPTLRLRPNNTHATYQLDIPAERWPSPAVGGRPLRERLVRARLCGLLELETEAEGLSILRRCCPSAGQRAAYELVRITNTGTKPAEFSLTCGGGEIDQTRGPMGINICEVHLQRYGGPVTLAPGEWISP